MMTASNIPSLRLAGALVGVVVPLLVAGPANGALIGDAPPDRWNRLFSFGSPFGAADYILMALALISAIVTGLFYYRANLLDGLKKMQKPARVKLRAAGLALAVFALVMLLAPGVPAGLSGALVAIGLLVAAFAGLGVVAVVVVVVLAAAFFTLWLTGLLAGSTG